MNDERQILNQAVARMPSHLVEHFVPLIQKYESARQADHTAYEAFMEAVSEELQKFEDVYTKLYPAPQEIVDYEVWRQTLDTVLTVYRSSFSGDTRVVNNYRQDQIPWEKQHVAAFDEFCRAGGTEEQFTNLRKAVQAGLFSNPKSSNLQPPKPV